jgi:hypothetical protein
VVGSASSKVGRWARVRKRVRLRAGRGIVQGDRLHPIVEAKLLLGSAHGLLGTLVEGQASGAERAAAPAEPALLLLRLRRLCKGLGLLCTQHLPEEVEGCDHGGMLLLRLRLSSGSLHALEADGCFLLHQERLDVRQGLPLLQRLGPLLGQQAHLTKQRNGVLGEISGEVGLRGWRERGGRFSVRIWCR